MIALPLKLLPYARRHRREVMRLVNDWRVRMHVHLDWQTLDEWIDQLDTPIYLAWHDHELIGLMAAAPPQADTAWVRLLALHDQADAESVLAALWPALRGRLIGLGVRQVGILLTQPWLAAHLTLLGFHYVEQIVTLRRDGLDYPSALRNDLVIRHADARETAIALDIDHAAFGPMWQMSAATMRHAIRNAASFTLAELARQPVGYQITTLHMRTAHLARLAVRPGIQGSGVGGALLGEMIDSMARRGVASVTVNTQASNMQSRRLYERYGFFMAGLDMPYWSCLIS
jgi:GNAT superfamily N-acetyltransferase